jgi:type IV fimbrial biogenesis protein FimT
MTPMNRSRQAGFTLTEMLITVGVASILMIIAVPNMRDFILNNRLSAGVNDMLHALQVARTEAIKRQQGNVVVCGSANPDAGNPTCDYATFKGWIVFQDLDNNWQRNGAEPVIERHSLLDATVTVKTDAFDRIVSYAPTGFANPAGAHVPMQTLIICDSRGIQHVGTGATARALFVTRTGRARSSATWLDVNGTASAQVGGCP